jgi:hypothetical protein
VLNLPNDLPMAVFQKLINSRQCNPHSNCGFDRQLLCEEAKFATPHRDDV